MLSERGISHPFFPFSPLSLSPSVPRHNTRTSTSPQSNRTDIYISTKGDFREANYKQTFYGINYDRLRAIKSVYDPDNIFYATTAVGADEWVVKVDGRLCRV